MRGKEFLIQIVRDGVRITPAYAGKSMIAYVKEVTPQDHPRVCGEKHTTMQSYTI